MKKLTERICVVLVLLLLLTLGDVNANNANNADEEITHTVATYFAMNPHLPSEYFIINSDGHLQNRAGEIYDITKGKLRDKIEEDIAKQVKALGENSFVSLNIDVGLRCQRRKVSLYYSAGEMGWGTDFSIHNSLEPSVWVMEVGEQRYTVYVPAAREKYLAVDPEDSDGTIWLERKIAANVNLISNLDIFIAQHKEIVRQGVVLGGLKSSVNVFTLYSDAQVILGHPTEEGETSGLLRKEEGLFHFNMSGSTQIGHSLDFFLHPFLGMLLEVPKTTSDWRKLGSAVNFETRTPTSYILLSLHRAYSDFKREDTVMSMYLTKLEAPPRGVSGVPEVVYRGERLDPASYVNHMLPIGVPTQFERKGSSYILADNGVELLEGYRLGVKGMRLFRATEAGNFEDIGILSDFNDLTGNELALTSYTDVGGIRRGVVLPLKFNEVIHLPKEERTYPTGRALRFEGDYTGGLRLCEENANLFTVSALGGVRRGLAFNAVAYHYNLTIEDEAYLLSELNKPSSVRLHYSFIYNEGKNKGFALYRNNASLNDESLIHWLNSEAAKGVVFLESEKLLGVIRGSFTLSGEDLGFNSWLRMQEIKNELDQGIKERWLNRLNIFSIIFGVFLVFYSILLFYFYLLDVSSSVLPFSLLTVATFGGLRPCSSLGLKTKEVKGYVTFKRMLVYGIAGITLGILFVFFRPVFGLFLYLYRNITTILGAL